MGGYPYEPIVVEGYKPLVPLGFVARECPYNHPVGTRCPACANWPYKKGGASEYQAQNGETE